MDKTIPKTELLYHKNNPIDQLSTIDAVNLMIKEQGRASFEVKKSARAIECAILEIYDHLTIHKYGRLMYVGSGTSGRIGVQDGVELYPTFNWPLNRLDYIIAGGTEAILNAVENAEDNIKLAKNAVTKKNVNTQDVVIGLAASGNTPFTCKVMEEAQKTKALTISISNNPFGEILKFGKVKIILDTGEEVIAGSTRLKAGTAQKICLNVISSMVMVKMGRVKNGLMSSMVPTNEKLRKRKMSIKSKI